MAVVSASNGIFSVKAYVGDSKTLLAFNFSSQAAAKNLAGFTIHCQPPGGVAGYYLLNELQFQTPGNHARVATEPANSTVNAPIQKMRWVHVTGQNHQGLTPAVGDYVYTVTPRFFDANQSMQPVDATLSASVTVPVGPFSKGAVTLGFTRGYMQSEAFSHHFGLNARLQPPGKTLLFDTTQQAGTNALGQTFTYADEYGWMGASARVQVFDVLNEALNDASVQVDVFAYDLNEPDVLNLLLKLAAQGRIRIILDNASLHHDSTGTKPEDQFEALFTKQAKGNAGILRGKFGRFSHDKIFILSKGGAAYKVLTGSTNFSVTGLYVNANHVLVFNDATVAAKYAEVFEESWSDKASMSFAQTALAAGPFAFGSATVPKMTITYSPHTSAEAATILQGISDRINAEGNATNGNVLFAVMQLTGSNTPVYNTLAKIHNDAQVFSYGISDAPGGTFLYKNGSKDGVLVTGKPGKVTLPPPFDQVPGVAGHEIHDKFIVCGLNGSDPVVWCGSSNLASGGEAANGDNLLQIHDADVATAFAIEALLLVDHYAFLDRYAAPAAAAASKPKTSASVKVKPVTAAMVAPKKKTPAKKKAVKKAATKPAKKKPAVKKVAIRKATPAKKTAPAKAAAATTPASATPLVARQPRSGQQAALTAGVYLATTDAWVQPYFDPNDLHGMERVLFG
jgi:hypothetical protein